jgi:hypothetical protein
LYEGEEMEMSRHRISNPSIFAINIPTGTRKIQAEKIFLGLF